MFPILIKNFTRTRYAGFSGRSGRSDAVGCPM